MLRILLTTPRPQVMRRFSHVLTSDVEVHLHGVASGAEALLAARAESPHLAIIDCELPDMQPMELVRELLRLDAMVNTAVVSPLPEREFHEASEGLGILSRLPVDPGEHEAEELLSNLRRILGC